MLIWTRRSLAVHVVAFVVGDPPSPSWRARPPSLRGRAHSMRRGSHARSSGTPSNSQTNAGFDGSRELKRLQGLQERLGELNDLTVLRDELRRFAEQTGMDEILSLTERRRREPVKGFAKTWPKAARRLRKAKARRLSRELAPALVDA